MRRIRSKDTVPELQVRRMLRSLGFIGYRIHRKDLPGKPDVAFVARKKAVFVHGCFWHGHACTEGVRKPKSNAGYWLPKIAGNQERDARHIAELSLRGWQVLTVWECELREPEALSVRLSAFMASSTRIL